MPDSRELFMFSLSFPPELRFGCIHLAGADQLSLGMVFMHVDKGEIVLKMDADLPEPWDANSFVNITSYDLPAGKAELEHIIEWFSDGRKKRAKLPEGIPFEPSILALTDLPEGWHHEGFARSSRDFLHFYRGRKQAVMVRLYGGKSGPVLDHPLFQVIVQNLQIVPGQWVTEFPHTFTRPGAEPEYTATTPPDDVATEIVEAMARARQTLELGRIRKPSRVAEAIYQHLEETRQKRRLSDARRQQLAIDLGALWGDALRRETGWEWAVVSDQEENEAYVVCPPHRSHLVDPIVTIHEILKSKRRDNNSLLLFNMIAAGDVPYSPENGFCWLS